MDNNNNAVVENLSSEDLKALSKAAEEEKQAGVNWKNVWDKVTTGILILLMCSPFAILLYIFLWFILK